MDVPRMENNWFKAETKIVNKRPKNHLSEANMLGKLEQENTKTDTHAECVDGHGWIVNARDGSSDFGIRRFAEKC